MKFLRLIALTFIFKNGYLYLDEFDCITTKLENICLIEIVEIL